MKMKHMLSLLATLLLAVSCVREPADWVNVWNGTDFAGNTYPGVTLPFGAVQLSPDTDANTCSGYRFQSLGIFLQNPEVGALGALFPRGFRGLRPQPQP